MDADNSTEQPQVKIQATVATDINLALAQNSVPIIRDLAIVNPEGLPSLGDLVLRIDGDPSFCEGAQVIIDRLGDNLRLAVDHAEPKLNLAYLRGLSECVRGSLRFTLSDRSGKVIAALTHEVRVLAHDEWGGASNLPELIAAFVQPNDDAIGLLLRQVIEALREARLPDALNGYENRSPRQAAQLIAAIWKVVCALGLGYALPPASFEKVGQKIRLPSRVCKERIGSCLDITLLFAALLEQSGFRPLVLFKKGHAFVGCWLKLEDFSAPVVDDLQAIRKRSQLKELLVFESTLAAQSTPARFDFACDIADAYLDSEEEFICAIDVSRARQSGIRPVVLKVGEISGIQSSSHVEGFDVGLNIPCDIPDELEEIEETREAPPSTPDARVIRWKRKLLDLTLRNPLLNFHSDARAIKVACHDPALLEDIVAAGDKIKILPVPEFGGSQDPRDLELRRRREQEDLIEQHAKDALARMELITRHDKDGLDVRLTNLYRLAKAALEEGGANILWLAIGILSWKPIDQRHHEGKTYRAPLVMIPVELSRISVGSRPTLHVRDEKSRVNDTLLQMLRQDFHLVVPTFEGELPTDESGLDVPTILNTMRHAIRDLKGWELTEEVILSTWSFAKFLMYQDLDARADQLKQAPVVKHLIDTPDQEFNDGLSVPTPDTLDQIDPGALFVPMEADSSQLAAIASAARGKTFVLRGPPGTGKSQTISNIIAHSIGSGKRVLFVSEKTAALEAVYSRLSKIGLGKYCLQLHSNKTSKDAFVTQLGDAWTARGELDERVWHHTCADLKRHRDTLNQYVGALHKRYRNGWSVYRAIGEVTRYRGAPCVEWGQPEEHQTDSSIGDGRVGLGWSDPNAHSQEDFERLLDIVRRIDVDIVKCGGVHDNPFASVVRGNWSPSWQSSLIAMARKLKQVVDHFESSARNFMNAIGLPDLPLSEDRIGVLQALPKLLKTVHKHKFGELLGPHEGHVPKLKEIHKLLEEYGRAMDDCSVEYQRHILGVDLNAWSADWSESKTSWWPHSSFLSTRVRYRLRQFAQDRAKPDPEHDLPRLRAATRGARALEAFSGLAQDLEWVWGGLDTDRTLLSLALEWQESAVQFIGQLASEPTTWEECRSALVTLVVHQNERLGEDGAVMRAAHDFQAAVMELMRLRGEASQISGGELAPNSQNLPAELRHIADGWLMSEAKLKAWCAWRAVRAEAIQYELGPLVDALEVNSAPGMSAEQLFVYGYAKWFLHASVDREEVLCNFVSREHELRIQEFTEIDDLLRDYTVQYIRAQLQKPIPIQGRMGSTATDSSWGKLNREINRSRGRTPIRQLLRDVAEPVLTLTPCLMMSPISVAQYLDPATPLFDLVIFDEASQIPTHDAIGSLARARQAVIAGDDKQLPPTSFFDRQDSDEDVSAKTPEDLESILDECRAARVPVISLNWHYRSRDESLIAFSNYRYYNGDLVTFPSPVMEGRAVTMHYVSGGIYDKGNSRTNRLEAEEVVRHVTGMMRDPVNVDLSFGVLTFNAEQQNLIQDLIETEVRHNRGLEVFFDEAGREPYFTKNLESVQGDERDVIVFSTTYGRDGLGKISMNFGPLNKPGGQRRLNVAVSRAKVAMHVFSSLSPDDLDLNRTTAEGVRDFKLFLDYALRGLKSLLAGPATSVGGHESPLEAQVADSLRAKGWVLHSQIGVAHFRIDMGVVHPTNPGRYFAGIECDGATYHRSATARDRDLLRERVLNGLGWKILRVWSTDFWLDPGGTIDSLHNVLQELTRATETEAQFTTTGSCNGASHASTEEHSSVPQFDSVATPSAPDSEITSEGSCIPYIEAPCFPDLCPEAFWNDSYRSTLRRLIKHFVHHEGPIRIDVLARKVARLHNMSRTGSAILGRVRELLPQDSRRTRDDGESFVWPPGVAPEAWDKFRIGMARDADEIAIQELTVLAVLLMKENVRPEDLVTEMGKKLGLLRVRQLTRERLERAVELTRHHPQ